AGHRSDHLPGHPVARLPDDPGRGAGARRHGRAEQPRGRHSVSRPQPARGDGLMPDGKATTMERQLRSRQRVDAVDPNDTPLKIRMRRISAGTRTGLQELSKSRTATVGGIMIVFLFIVCLLTPVLATHDPIKPDYRDRLAPMSSEHYFGTDKFG